MSLSLCAAEHTGLDFAYNMENPMDSPATSKL